MAQTYAERHDAYEIRSKAERLATRAGSATARKERVRKAQIANWKACNPGQEFVPLTVPNKLRRAAAQVRPN